MPPPRAAVMLTDVEQHKLENDLVSARDQQQTAAGVPRRRRRKHKQEPAQNRAAQDKEPAKPSAPQVPAASSRHDLLGSARTVIQR